jgi:tRNA U34 5-methylaminomethyl-2-thiouridine-forming methyltransferase MnmC
MKSSELRTIVTKDGSHTLFVPDLDETYHSTNGALTESSHVFIDNGLDHFHAVNPSQDLVEILEMGFGTGLNVLLALKFAKDNNLRINYTAVEAFPISWELVEALNYSEFAEITNYKKLFGTLHSSAWEVPVILDDLFQLHKRQVTFQDLRTNENSVDVIFFDAFAPSRQPEVWSRDIIERMYYSLKPNGLLVTYCAQGQFKRNLRDIGFETEVLEGPPGKKEMIRASKSGM